MEKSADTNKKAVWWLSSAHGIIDVYSGFLTPLMPFLALKIGFSLAIATIITSLSQVISSTIQPLFGYFADNCNKRFFVFWGLILGSISNPIAANVNNIWLLFIFIVLGNLGGSFFHPQALGFIFKFSEKNSIFNMSLFVSAGTIGFALGPLISSSVVQLFGYDKLLLLSCVGIVTALLMFKFVPKSSNLDNNTVRNNLFTTFKDIFSSKIMIILLAIGLMKSLIQSSCSIMMPFLWRDLGHSPMFIGVAMFLFLFAGGIGSLSSSWLEQKFGARFVFYCSMITTFPLMFLFTYLCESNPVYSLVIFVFMGYLTMLAQPVTLILAQRAMPQYKSVVSGIINGFTWGIVSVVLIILGFVAEKTGIKEILLFLSVIPAIFSYLVKFVPNKIDD